MNGDSTTGEKLDLAEPSPPTLSEPRALLGRSAESESASPELSQDSLSPLQKKKLQSEIAKLELEKENLQKKNKWESKAPLIPILASIVTLTGLYIGFLQFQSQKSFQQKKTDAEERQQRVLKLQDQMRNDGNEISRFTRDPSQTLSRLSYLLDDMKKLIQLGIDEEKSQDSNKGRSQSFSGYQGTMTRALLKQIVDDTDFMKNPKEVIFTNTIATDWEDYSNHLKKQEQLPVLDGILYKYVRTLRYLRERNEKYFKNLAYEGDHYELVDPTLERVEGEETLFQHFKSSLEGFKLHLDLLSEDARALRIKQDRIRDFGDAVCIESVARHILGDDFMHRPCMKRKP